MMILITCCTRSSSYRALKLSRLLLALLLFIGMDAYASNPTQPSGLRYAIYSTTAAELFWERSSDDGAVSYYEITRNGELLGQFDALSYFDAGLAGGREYSYAVVAVDNQGNRSVASEIGFSTSTSGEASEPTYIEASMERPSTPAGLSVSIYSPTALELMWQRSVDDGLVVGYEVEKNGIVQTVLDGLSFVDFSLSPGVVYSFRVTAIDNDGLRSDSTSIEVTTDGEIETAPTEQEPTETSGIITGLTAQRYSATAAELFWDRPLTPYRGFQIIRDGIVIATTQGNSYFDDSLVGGAAYEYLVSFISDIDSASASATVRVPALGEPSSPTPIDNDQLAKPASLSSITYSPTAVELFWDRSPAPVTRYEVSRDDSVLKITNGTSFFDATLIPGQSYQYVVVSLDDNGNRSAASELNLTTTGSDSGGTTTDGMTNGTDPLAESGLTHEGRVMPKGNATPANSNLYSSTGPAQAAALAEPLSILFEVVQNNGPNTGIDCKPLEAHFAACSVVNLHIKDANASLDDGNWRLYFHSLRRVLQVNSDDFDIYAVNGDLHYLTPSANFQGFGNSPVKTLALVTEYNFIHESDVLPRYWLVRDGQSPQVLANTDTNTEVRAYVLPVTGDNRKLENADTNPVASSSNRFDRFESTPTLNSVAELIIPTPMSVTVGSATRSLGGGLAIDSNVLSAASLDAIQARLATFYTGSGAAMPVSTSIANQLNTDQYRLIVDNSGASISGGSAEAVFHGAQSLLALITPGSASIPHIDITDAPRFEYRGMHTDVARHFQSVVTLKRLIDQMAAYKLNRLHLHLTDDEGWRLQIPSLPELTDVGARRSFQLDSNGNPIETDGLLPQLGNGPGSSNQGSGFYSRADYVDLLRYANARYVQVIPSMDMPAHARAAVVSMRVRAANLGAPSDTTIRLDDPADPSRYLTIQHYDDNIINPCVEGTYNFFQTVVTDVNAMYADAGAPLSIWHMGGDEASSIFKSSGFQDVNDPDKVFWKGDVDQSTQDNPWERSPACQQLIAADSSLNNLEDLSRHFITRISQIVSNAGIESLYGWHDITRDVSPATLATSKAGVTYWEQVNVVDGGNNAYAMANDGFETVLSVPDYLYFDFVHEADPQERGQYWGARFIDTRKVFSFAPSNLPQNAETGLTKLGNTFSATGVHAEAGFKGMQGQLWSELISEPALYDYMVYPRLLALAERAWHRGSWELDYAVGTAYSNSSGRVDQSLLNDEWNRFANALGRKELPKLDAQGVSYRIPPPGAKTQNGVLEMNASFPGLGLEYSTNGNTWQPYSPTNPPSSAVAVRARSADGARAGRETALE